MSDTPVTVGSVIHGTHRPQDLIPAFLKKLEEVDPLGYAQMTLMPFGPVPSYVYDEGDKSEWWESEDAHALLTNLFDALDNAAPEGYQFGAHPGDGSDFGYWEVDEDAGSAFGHWEEGEGETDYDEVSESEERPVDNGHEAYEELVRYMNAEAPDTALAKATYNGKEVRVVVGPDGTTVLAILPQKSDDIVVTD